MRQTLTVHWDRHSLCTGKDILCAVGQTLTVQWDRHSLCSGTDTHCAVGQTLTVQCEQHTRRAETVVAGYSWSVPLGVCVWRGGAGRGAGRGVGGGQE